MSTLVGWWKGEDDLVDSVNGNDIVIDGPGIEYDTGIINRCFKTNAYNILIIPQSDEYTANHTMEFYVKYSIEGILGNIVKFDIYRGALFSFNVTFLYNATEENFSITVIQAQPAITQLYELPISILPNNTFVLIKFIFNNGRFEIYISNNLQSPIEYKTFNAQSGDFRFLGEDEDENDNSLWIDEIKIYDDSLTPEYIMIKELECFLAKKQATYGTQGDDLTGDNYFPALPDSKVEVITAMTDIETVSATYDHDLSVRGFVNANAELSCYMRSLGDSVEPDYALLARAAGWAVAGPTGGKYTLTPIINPTTATGNDLEVWHYLGGIGSNASVLTKIGNVVGNWKITGDVGKPVVFALTGAKGLFVSQAAATMVTSVSKDRTLIPAALPVTVSINNVAYKIMKFSFEGGNTVEQYIDCAETYGFGDSEITKKKIKFSFTCYANAALANPLDAVIAGDVVADVSIIWGKTLYTTKIVVDDPQFTDCKTVDVGGLTGWEVTGNATQNDITIVQNNDHV